MRHAPLRLSYERITSVAHYRCHAGTVNKQRLTIPSAGVQLPFRDMPAITREAFTARALLLPMMAAIDASAATRFDAMLSRQPRALSMPCSAIYLSPCRRLGCLIDFQPYFQLMPMPMLSPADDAAIDAAAVIRHTLMPCCAASIFRHCFAMPMISAAITLYLFTFCYFHYDALFC